MKTNFVSTWALSAVTRQSIGNLQQRIAEGQKEMNSGRYADIGASLGHRTGDTVSLRQEYAGLKTIMDTNNVVNTRLDSTQTALKALGDMAQSFIGTLNTARSAENGAGIAGDEASANIVSFINLMNTSIDGAYIFAGINADVKPIQDYSTSPPSASDLAVTNAFVTEFGFPPTDPQAKNISAADMTAFLDGPFAALFDDPAWSDNWSSASDQNMRSRISTNELIETSTNANDPALRKMVSAYTMVASLTGNLNQTAFQAVADKASTMIGEAIGGIINIQAKIGNAQARVENANDRMQIQMNVMTNGINQFERVDPYEASLRVADLLQQLDTSYALTARIQQLSILNYL
jgi:flagellar hook-associated protein 3 FlgL